MNRKLAAVAAVVTLTSTLAFAAPHGGRGQGGRHGKADFAEKFAQKLNLTDAQKAQIKQIHLSSREQNKVFFEQSRATRKALREARQANDTARLEQLKATMEADGVRFKQIREAEMAQVLSVLTPEQRAQFEALKAEGKARRGQRGQRD